METFELMLDASVQNGMPYEHQLVSNLAFFAPTFFEGYVIFWIVFFLQHLLSKELHMRELFTVIQLNFLNNNLCRHEWNAIRFEVVSLEMKCNVDCLACKT